MPPVVGKFDNNAAIIPLAHFKSTFKLPYPDYMSPIGEGKVILDHVIHFCVKGGCRTIWIVINKDLSSLVRKHVGDFVKVAEKIVPIFYVPCNPTDIDKRDTYGYDVIYGATCASKFTAKLSDWVTPEKYFIAWPMFFMPIEFATKVRFSLTRYGREFCVTMDGLNFRDGEMYPALLTPPRIAMCRYNIFHGYQLTSRYMPESFDEKAPRLPGSQQYATKKLKLEDVFEPLRLVPLHPIEGDGFLDLTDFDTYAQNLEYITQHSQFPVTYKSLHRSSVKSWRFGEIEDHLSKLREIHEA